MTVSDDLTLANIVKRMNSGTPTFFKKLRTVGLVLAAIGGALLTAPVSLPAVISAAGGYILTAGTVISAVCQTVTNDDKTK